MMFESRHGKRMNAFRIPLIGLFLAVALLSSLSWGECYQRDGGGNFLCIDGTGYNPGLCTSDSRCAYAVGQTLPTTYNNCGTGKHYVKSVAGGSPYYSYNSCWIPRATICCDSKSEADSAICVDGGEAWSNGECKAPFDSVTACADDKAQCQSIGGSWKYLGEVDGECSSVCDLCGTSAQIRVQNEVARACCAQNKAPPDSVVQCSTPLQSGAGMTSSVFADKSNSYGCGQLTDADGGVIEENAALYKKFCIDGEEYEENPESSGSGSSGSEGSSSSEETESSFGSELEALGGLYGVLDTIRDTIVKRLTPATEQILVCLQNAGLCPGLGGGGDTTIVNVGGDSSALRVDTTLRQTIKPLMQEGLKNDTLTRTAVLGIGDKVDSLIDSSVKYLKRVSDAVGAVGDSVGGLRSDIASWGTGPAQTDSGYGGFGDDSSRYNGTLDSAFGSATAAGDSAYDIEGDTCTSVDCIGGGVDVDSMGQAFTEGLDSTYDMIEDSASTWFTAIRENLALVSFDSMLIVPLENAVPNTNQCPENCFSGTITSQSKWLNGFSYNYGLCKSFTIGGFTTNPLLLIRLLLRIFTAITCIYLGLWYIAGKK